jgi:hypothetical protein
MLWQLFLAGKTTITVSLILQLMCAEPWVLYMCGSNLLVIEGVKILADEHRVLP